MAANIIRWLKRIYDKYVKLHCPACGGVLDVAWHDIKWDRLVYECRECKERWM